MNSERSLEQETFKKTFGDRKNKYVVTSASWIYVDIIVTASHVSITLLLLLLNTLSLSQILNVGLSIIKWAVFYPL